MVDTGIGATGTTDTMDTTNAEFDAFVATETLAIHPRHSIERHRPARVASYGSIGRNSSVVPLT